MYFDDRANDTYGGADKGWEEEKTIRPGTIAKERALLHSAFAVAKAKNFWGVCYDLENPLDGLKLNLPRYDKERGLLKQEEEALVEEFENCQGLNKYYGPLGMYLSLETAMRLQEVAYLKWTDIAFDTRRIEIRKSKTDKRQIKKGRRAGGRIALPVYAMKMLMDLWQHLNTKRTLPTTGQPGPHIKRPIEYPDSYIFINRYGKPMTPAALADVFTKAVARAVKRGVIQHKDENEEILTFHCLRRVAHDMFGAAGLPLEERMLMMRENNKSLDAVYTSKQGLETFLKTIEGRLDRHVLKLVVRDKDNKPVLNKKGELIREGVTLAEMVEEWNGGEPMTNLEMLNDGGFPFPLFTRQERVAIPLFAQGAIKECLQEKVFVLKSNEQGVWVGERMTKDEAIKITGVETDKLLNLDVLHKGELREAGYRFMSEASLSFADMLMLTGSVKPTPSVP
jgi:integrase